MTDRVCARLGCKTPLTYMRADAVWCSRACKMAAQRAAEAAQSANTEPSQCDRLATALKLNGSIGITQADFSPPNVIDGFSPIPRLAARFHDLKTKRGIDVVRDGTREGFAVYKLASAVSSASAPPAPASYPAGVQGAGLTQPATSPPRDGAGADETVGALFDAPAAGPANALLGDPT